MWGVGECREAFSGGEQQGGMGWWGGVAGQDPIWPVPSKDQRSQLGRREVPGEEAASPTAGERANTGSCFSGGCTRSLPEDFGGPLAHLSLPKNLVLPL